VWGGGLCRVQVNSEQVSLESLVEAGESLLWISFHQCGGKTELELGRAMFDCPW